MKTLITNLAFPGAKLTAVDTEDMYLVQQTIFFVKAPSFEAREAHQY